MEYILWDLPNLTIDKQPCFEIDLNGELKLRWSGTGNALGRLPLLYDERGKSIEVVNQWLIHLKANNHRKQVSTQAQALLHYFIFLDDLNLKWDEMPIPPRNRPTYRFKKHLKEVFKNGGIARTTANNYMGVVVNFYKYYLARRHPFSNPPFRYEEVKIKLTGNHQFMRQGFIHVDTTDLRLNLPKDTSFGGLSRKLIPLSEEEWSLVDDIYRNQGEAISYTNGEKKKVSISVEFKLILALARYTGMRREELATFRSNMVFKPNAEQLIKKYLIHNNGILISPAVGVNTKGAGARRVEIPTLLMLNLHKYINSPRYIERRNKYLKKNPDEPFGAPLFITQKGNKYSGKTFDARWGEIRNAARIKYKNFDHKFHNLRSTYAVFRLKSLLSNEKLTEGEALDYLQAVMGHKNRSSLLSYLKFSKFELEANEIYEQAVDVLLGSDNDFNLV
ncbi:site-specific integrase [Spartinivicinus ruber]|uniref:site-specific integrase n=1 Tax=Spartinivicinus ruber TaxID=2683272 RepID=UPI0013D83EE0|nr:site-specific integrase [Spartinivicinus ruber]